jgi:ferrous iron transport protein B
MSAVCNTCGDAGCASPTPAAGGATTYVVALGGNPNTGKSTVFNALTGLKQHTGNWPGKTVARAEGSYTHRGQRFRLIDLPGTYSLSANSTDEQIARDFIWFSKPDAVVVVVDSTCLERNLHLVLQILEVTASVVVCLNLQDQARRKGIDVDAEALADELGVPVIRTVASVGRGLPELKDAMLETATSPPREADTVVRYGEPIESALAELVSQLAAAWPELSNPRWVALRMLHGDPSLLEAVRTGRLTETDHDAFVELGVA